ncbi:MAG: endonuclease/exonuclease/phosphatase family protein [Candidatus Marinimicrobia bacterium]|nr:endonuclease/exonuclease/phosphatase family protein [Candidatus Neomarinimicrobiota bacterium]
MRSNIIFILAAILSFNPAFPQQPEYDGNVIKVMTFNILHGATLNRDNNLTLIAKVINDASPDLVALQEVDYKTNRVNNIDLIAELGRQTNMVSIFAKAMDYDSGEYGVGILSKTTFLSSRNVAQPFTAGNEPRTALEITTILASGDTISFISTHLNHLMEGIDRQAQTARINEILPANRYPTILAGDLNDVIGSPTINLIETKWTLACDRENPQPTYPSNKPDRKIDYVAYYPPKYWKVIEHTVIQDSIASDHCAYSVILELLKSPAEN